MGRRSWQVEMVSASAVAVAVALVGGGDPGLHRGTGAGAPTAGADAWSYRPRTLAIVYGDGRVVGVAPTHRDLPAVPRVAETTIDGARVRALYAMARAAGVTTPPGDPGRPAIEDAGDAVFDVTSAGRTSTLRAYALGADARGLTATQTATRKDLVHLRHVLEDLLDTAGDHQPSTMGVSFKPFTGQRDAPRPVADWPLAPFATQPHDLPGCVAVPRADIDRVLQAAASTSTRTPWRSGDRLWTLAFRLPLPDEQACPMV